MRIQHNISAMNALRVMGGNNSGLSKSIEKLSSGFRINRAADDAAGLAVSEKMRSQIRGVDQAIANAQDGISFIQTAEGATQEVTSVLQRMKTLATQSANGLYDNTVDRRALQMEVDELSQELHRIVSETNYNGRNIFSATPQRTSQNGLDKTFTGVDPSTTAGLPSDVVLQVGAKGSETITIDSNILAFGKATQPSDDGATNGVVNPLSDNFATYGALAGVMAEGVSNAEVVKGGVTPAAALKRTLDIGGATNHAAAGGGAAYDDKGTPDPSDDVTTKVATTVNDDFSSFAALDTPADLEIAVKTANLAVTTIDNAINAVSVSRAYLGSVQNRLESTIRNQEVTSENLTDAESRIRDVDMAKEIANKTKYDVLTQASTAMLAQANATSQNVLQLLR